MFHLNSIAEFEKEWCILLSLEVGVILAIRCIDKIEEQT